jgi:hypothetical protein
MQDAHVLLEGRPLPVLQAHDYFAACLTLLRPCTCCRCAGTFIAGMLARHHRKRVHTLCVIDPVCFGMFMPHLLYNFLYRVPTWKGWRPAE